MARKKQRKTSWARMLALFLVTPVAIWLITFLLWFYWHDLSHMFARYEPGRMTPKAAPQMDRNEGREHPASEPPQEKIFEEDRQKLEDILKRRN
jgi:hypothetical protein